MRGKLLARRARGWNAITVPSGFEDQPVATIYGPTGLAATPDGRILLTSRPGQLRVYEDGSLRSQPALDLTDRVCTDIERGLGGVAVGPDFVDARHVYLYYTYKRGGTCSTSQSDPANQPVNRVSRFVLSDTNLIDPASETVLIDNIPNVNGNHIGGDLHFGKDGYLYVSVGDGGCDYLGDSGCYDANDASRDENVLLGKILRITEDGDVPADNPFLGPGTARCNTVGRTTPGTICQETYGWGLRNPFRFAFDPNVPDTRFYINDVGQATWEEIDLGQAGADYGWNVREGHCALASTTNCGPPPPGMTNPIFDYSHSTGCGAITGGAFVPSGLWPVQYDKTYLFADWVCGKIFQLLPNGSDGYTAVEFASGLTAPVAMSFAPFGPSQALYYVSYGTPDIVPGLRRIAYVGSGNRLPSARATAAPTSGDLPLNVSFDASASSDPDDDELSFDWDFGDGSPHASTAIADHTYTTADTYTATLTVADGRGGQDEQAIRIDAGNRAPVLTISAPAASKLFSVGEDLTLTGSASDPEDGTLSSSALTWEVVKHHANHTHPYLPPTSGDDVSITAPQPEDLASMTNSYLEIRLTATDSRGLSKTITQDLRPRLVAVELATSPSGLGLELNGLTAPSSFTSWAGWRFELNAPDPQFDSEGRGVTFVSWSDGGAQAHSVTTPTADTSYTAWFSHFYPRPKGATPVKVPLVPAYRPCSDPNAQHGAPLAHPSCAPPRQSSEYLSVGTPDANGFGARSIGSVRIYALAGNPSTPVDEADVRISASLTDVFDRSRYMDDYVGELKLSVGLRLTDRHSGSSGTETGTVSDFALEMTIPCMPNAEPPGSGCTGTSTADAILPGYVVEGRRAIWQLGQIRLFDGGSDGLVSTDDDDGLFAVQGVFTP